MRVRVAGIFTRRTARGPELLLARHEKGGRSYFLLPGGGVEEGESFAGALARECREEIGCEAALDDLAFVVESIAPDGSRHILQMAFRARLLSGDPAVHRSLDPRVAGSAWLTREEIKDCILYPDMRDELVRLLDGGAVARVHLGVRWDD